MPYAQIDVNFPEHWKALKLSPEAFKLFVVGLCHAQKLITARLSRDQKLIAAGSSDDQKLIVDGFIDARALPTLRARTTPKVIGELLAVGLWEETVNGYLIHDYAEWNRTSDQIARKREYDKSYTSRKRVVNDSETSRITATLRNATHTQRYAKKSEPTLTSTDDAPMVDDLWQSWRDACQAIGVTEFASMPLKSYPQAKQLLSMGSLSEWSAAFAAFLASPEFTGKRSWGMFLANAPQLLGHARSGSTLPFGSKAAAQPVMGVKGSRTTGNAAAAAAVIARIRQQAAQEAS